MADDSTQTTVQPTSQTKPSAQAQPSTADKSAAKADPNAQKKNPLDVLEELLSEIDGNDSGKKKAGGKNGAPAKPAGPTPEEIAAKELEENKRIYEEKKKKQAIIDAQLIAEQKRALEENMQTSDENKARHEQKEEKQAQKAQKVTSSEGFEIPQLDHTKI